MKKSILINIVQVLIIALIVPLLAAVLGNLVSIDTVVIKLISTVPIFNTWLSILYKYNTDVMNNTLNFEWYSPLYTFIETIFMAFVLKISNRIHEENNSKALPILSNFFGTITGLFLVSLISKFTSGIVSFLLYGLLIAIVLVGIRFLFSSLYTKINKNMGLKILELFMSGVSAFLTCGYISVLFFATNGMFVKIQYAIVSIIWFTILMIASAILSYLVSCFVKKVKTETYIK